MWTFRLFFFKKKKNKLYKEGTHDKTLIDVMDAPFFFIIIFV